MLKLFKHMKALDWLIIALNIVLIALQVQLDLKIPDYMSEVTVLVQSAGSQTADILYTGGKMLLLDEPSMGLAPIVVRGIFDIIQELQKEGMTILLVEQNANMALSIANRAYVLETGKISLEGPALEIKANDSVKKAYLGA